AARAGLVGRGPHLHAAEGLDGYLADPALYVSPLGGVEFTGAVGQDDRGLGLRERFVEGLVLAGAAQIRKVDVEPDHGGARLGQGLERQAVLAARDGIAANRRVVEALVVDADDQDAVVGLAGVVLRSETVLRVDRDSDQTPTRVRVAGQLLGTEPEHRAGQ